MASLLQHQPPADLQLGFAKSSEQQTYIQHQFCRHPFHVCRAQYLDSKPAGLATVYLQSSAGGIFANDHLTGNIHALDNAQCHITTQASTIVHRMDEGEASYRLYIRAEKNSVVEYLPDPMILFPLAKLQSNVLVRMHPDATVIIADAFMNHDPMTNQDSFGELHNETRIERLDGKLLCLDRYRVSGSRFIANQPGVMGPNKVQGTYMLIKPMYGARTELLNSLGAYLTSNFHGYAGVSTLPNDCGVWVRLIAQDAFSIVSAFQNLWALTRLSLMGERPQPRRK